jgi:thioredoxin reductase (NADPH)
VARPLKNLSEVVVIGGGLAGLCAARHAARLGRLVTLFEGSGLCGGLVATIGEVEDLPFGGAVSGQELAMAMLAQAQKMGVRLVEWPVERLELGEKLRLTDGAGEVYQPEVVIVASGAKLRHLGVAGEAEFLGRGVSRCATCDGGFFKDKHVVVVGGGDGAVHEALTLAKTSRMVHVVARSPLRAKREHIDRLAARHNVQFHWDSEVSAITGEAAVSGVKLRHVASGTESDLAVSGVFPFIGVEPVSGFLPAELLTDSGHMKAGADTRTADARIFAAGAIRADFGGTGVQAMAEGVGAAEAANRV